MKKDIIKDFVDESGNNAEMTITTDGNEKIDLGPKYKLQRPESDNKYMKKNAKAKGILTSDIGFKSEGFAPIFTLALIIAIGAIIAAYVFWKI